MAPTRARSAARRTRGIGEQLARLASIAATPRAVRGSQAPPDSVPVPTVGPVQLALFQVDAAAIALTT